jgi:PST family polysaccharide transporter
VPGAGTPLRVRSGLGWTAAQSWGTQLLSLAVFVVLARLVSPAAFGVVAMANVFVQLMQIAVDQGLTSALVQRDELEDDHLHTAFWMNTGAGAFLTLAGMAAAGPIAALYGEPALVPVLRILSFGFLITSLGAVHEALLTRGLRFKALAARSLSASVLGGVAGIGVALWRPGPEALVVQALTGSAVGAALLWLNSGWRPRLRFSRERYRDIAAFGGSVLGMRLMNFLSRRSDDLLIGFFLGAAALGYYAIAYKILKVFVDMFTKIVSRVALPALSRMQAEPERLREAVARAVQLSGFVAFPVFVACGVLAGQIVPVVFGPHWLPSIPVMRVLVWMGVLQAVVLILQQAMVASGHPGRAFRFMMVNTALTLAAFGVGVKYGIVAVALAYTVTAYATSPWYFALVHRTLGVSPGVLAARLRTPAIAAVALAVCAGGVVRLVAGQLSPAATLALGAGAGAAAYLAVAGALEWRAVAEFRRRRHASRRVQASRPADAGDPAPAPR